MIALMVLAGCVPPPEPPPGAVPVTGPETDYRNAAAYAKERNYHEAITLYRRIAAEAPQSPEAADALFEVAYITAFYENPLKDYAQALLGFEDFLKRYPDHLKAPHARNWRAVLKVVLDARKENERLKKSIEELKKLDIRHEERRTR
jgi:TolA-binding protein